MKKTLIYTLIFLITLFTISAVVIFITHKKPPLTCPIGQTAIWSNCSCDFFCIDEAEAKKPRNDCDQICN